LREKRPSEDGSVGPGRPLRPAAMPAKMNFHPSGVLVSPSPKAVASERNHRTALGASIHWWPAYNDGLSHPTMGIGFGEVTTADTRALQNGPAGWAEPKVNNRMLWDEKFTGPPPSEVSAAMGCGWKRRCNSQALRMRMRRRSRAATA
jgi:hypothetical protein